MYQGQVAVFATQHEKEKIFQRPVTTALGLKLLVPDNIDTDQFGTFSGEIPRAGTMLDALNAKVNLGMKLTGLKLGFASEGSFGPHPQNPFVPANREMAIFIDEKNNLKICEQIISYKTNYASIELSEDHDSEQLELFLKRVHFPHHAIILKQVIDNKLIINKGIQSYPELIRHLKNNYPTTIETDMRAHLNPLRRQVIRELAFKLMRRILSCCPRCQKPGWGLINTKPGLACIDCCAPTKLVKHEIFGCAKCSYQESRAPAHGLLSADPQHCDFCNP